MRELTSTATGVANKPIEQCFEHLTDIERYPAWYPDGAKRVDVLERGDDGKGTKVDAMLAVAAGPLRKNFNVRLQMQTDRPNLVAFSRVADDRGDHEALTITWKLSETGADRTQITLEMTAFLDVPPFLPVGQVAREAANGFLNAALKYLG